jgi:hypothetical protein
MQRLKVSVWSCFPTLVLGETCPFYQGGQNHEQHSLQVLWGQWLESGPANRVWCAALVNPQATGLRYSNLEVHCTSQCSFESQSPKW